MRARCFIDKAICVSEWAEYARPPWSLMTAHQRNEVTNSQAKKNGWDCEKKHCKRVGDNFHHVRFNVISRAKSAL